MIIEESRIRRVQKLIESLRGVDRVTILLSPDRTRISDVLVLPRRDVERKCKHIQKDIRAILANTGFEEVCQNVISIASFKRTRPSPRGDGVGTA
ncbi:MAG: hypothetical protein ACUVXI_02645 [bacterium]